MKFNLRDLFWLTFVVAVSLGWLVYYVRTSQKIAKLQEDKEWWEQESYSARASAYNLHQELLKRDDADEGR